MHHIRQLTNHFHQVGFFRGIVNGFLQLFVKKLYHFPTFFDRNHIESLEQDRVIHCVPDDGKRIHENPYFFEKFLFLFFRDGIFRESLDLIQINQFFSNESPKVISDVEVCGFFCRFFSSLWDFLWIFGHGHGHGHGPGDHGLYTHCLNQSHTISTNSIFSLEKME